MQVKNKLVFDKKFYERTIPKDKSISFIKVSDFHKNCNVYQCFINDNKKISLNIAKCILVNVSDNEVKIIYDEQNFPIVKNFQKKFFKSIVNTIESVITNAIKGVKTPYKEVLILNGIEYKVKTSKENNRLLIINVGYCNDTKFIVPDIIDFKVTGNTIFLESIDNVLLGNFATLLKTIKKRNVYKGKGIFSQNEKPRIKKKSNTK